MAMKRRAPRDQVAAVRFSVEELAEVERSAENERMDRSEYIRGATLCYMALRGNKLAWRLLGEGMVAQLKEAARKTAAL
jgi:hypothetical protein